MQRWILYHQVAFRQHEGIFLIRYIVESIKKNALGTHHRAERLLSNHLCDQIVQTLSNEKKTKSMTDQKNTMPLQFKKQANIHGVPKKLASSIK